LFILRTWRWRRHDPPKCQLNFKGLHDVVFQKIEIFITAAVRTSKRCTCADHLDVLDLNIPVMWRVQIMTLLVTTLSDQRSVYRPIYFLTPLRRALLEELMFSVSHTVPLTFLETQMFITVKLLRKVPKNKK
jgi:hypothetical protein